MRGGARPGAGRKKGSRSKATVERERAVAEMTVKLQEALPNVFTGNAHQLLMAVYKNEDLPLPTRIDAAKAAISHETPKLGSIEHKGDAENPVQTVTRIELSAPEIDNCQNSAAAQAAMGIFGPS